MTVYPVPGPERRRAPAVLTSNESVERAAAGLRSPSAGARAAAAPMPAMALTSERRVTVLPSVLATVSAGV